MNFFKTVYTLCTRTSALPDFLQTPVWRALLHGLLLMLLCPLLIATVETCRAKSKCENTLQRLERTVGSLGFAGDDMCLGGSFAEKSHRFDLFGLEMRLDYVGEKSKIDEIKPDLWTEKAGVLLTRDNAIIWVKTDSAFQFMVLPAEMIKALTAKNFNQAAQAAGQKNSQPQMNATKSMLTPQSSEKLLLAAKAEPKQKNASQAASDKIDATSTGKIVFFLLASYSMGVFMLYFMELLFLFLFCGLCFAFIEHLILRATQQLTFAKVYMLTIYAMFPAVVIAMFATLSGQTFLSFQTIFLISFFIYQLFSFRQLALHFNPPEKRKQDDYPDDDDF